MACLPQLRFQLFKQVVIPTSQFAKYSLLTDVKYSGKKKGKKVNVNKSEDFSEQMLTLYKRKLLEFDKCLNTAAEDFYKISPKVRKYRNKIFNSIKSAVVGDSDRSVFMIGSSGSGLASESSDIDLVVFTSKDAKLREKNKQILSSKTLLRKYMHNLARRIGKCCPNDFDCNDISIISNARVPILVLQTKKNLKIEIQLNSENCLRNTLFLRNIVMKDSRIPVLIFWAKEWLRTLNLKNSKLGLFSSYHTALLDKLIQFTEDDLACDISPNAPLEVVISRLSAAQPPIIKVNRDLQPSVTELILHFIDYYSTLDFHKVHIFAASSVVKKRPENEFDETLCITDPFSTSTICLVKNGANLFAEAVAFTKRSMLAGKGLSWPMNFLGS
uniref:NTP_transf_2 domain-containing protein n=1 Tax=Syphacia muris TaxID=451379 RepID=A0A0N5AQH7_9BILA